MEIEKIYNEFLDKCKNIYGEEEVSAINKAYLFGVEHHKDKLRRNGTPYMTHPLGVAEILLDLNVDAITMEASLIHETINHGGATKEEIEELFGEEVAEIVSVISKINRLELNDDSEMAAQNFRKILVGMSEDVRILFIKLADRLHNLRTGDVLEKEEIKQKVNETLSVLIPIAHRLGLYGIKGELEDWCLKYSKPDVYRDIQERLKTYSRDLQDNLAEMEQSISDMLNEQNIPFHIKSRVKSVYSIYNKLSRGKTWDTIYDILALRVIVDTIPQCYLTIGLIHAKYRPIPGRFKDYIAMPKANMYQSLHTGVFGSDGNRYEIQVRTEEMDEFDEKGVASHFAYKEHHYVRNMMEQKLESFRNLIESANNLSDIEFETDIKTDFLNDSIYVFTPKGDVLELPMHSTPIDFAYRIHTNVGDQTVGAIVNDQMVPLNHELQNNDIVSIKTQKGSTPSLEWLKFVKTSHARNKIKSYFSKQDKEEYTNRGKEILLNELRRKKIPFETVINNDTIKKICQDLKLKDLDDIYFSIGSLRYTVTYIISLTKEDKRDVRDVLIEKVNSNISNINKGNFKSDLLVNGESGILVNLAKCCHPVRGDDVVGFITKGEGVTVHRSDCPNLVKSSDRLINVSWTNNEEDKYLTNVIVRTITGKNYLLDLISKATAINVYVEQVKTKEKDDYTEYVLTLKLSNIEELDKYIVSVKNYKFVKEVVRE